MNDPEPPISEDELHAYVDEQLEPSRRAAVARYLEQNPAAADRAQAYISQRERLRTAFAPIAVEPIPANLHLGRLVEERLARRRSPWRIAGGIVLLLGVGGAAGWSVRSLTAPATNSGVTALEHEAVANHLVYATDPRHPAEFGAGQRDDLTQWVSSRLKHPIAPPDLDALGYRFIGGRLVATEHGAAALFLYDNRRGERLSIFVRPMERDRNTPILVLDIGDVDGCAWVDKGVGYTLIAEEPYKELLRMSEFVRKQIGGRA